MPAGMRKGDGGNPQVHFSGCRKADGPARSGCWGVTALPVYTLYKYITCIYLIYPITHINALNKNRIFIPLSGTDFSPSHPKAEHVCSSLTTREHAGRRKVPGSGDLEQGHLWGIHLRFPPERIRDERYRLFCPALTSRGQAQNHHHSSEILPWVYPPQGQQRCKSHQQDLRAPARLCHGDGANPCRDTKVF